MNRRNLNSDTKYLKKQLKQILEMEEKGIFPNTNFILDSYNIVFMYRDNDYYESDYMYNLYSSFIKKCIKESIYILNIATSIDFIILFNKQIDRIKYIFFFVNKVFMCLDKYYIKQKNLPSLKEQSFNLYINDFFIPLKDILFMSLTFFFKEIENKDSEQNQQNIKKVIKIMKELDELSKPKLVKKNNEIIWANENNNIPPKKYELFDYWYNKLFLK